VSSPTPTYEYKSDYITVLLPEGRMIICPDCISLQEQRDM